jgi:IclR family acetate operon transcriptional repressor
MATDGPSSQPTVRSVERALDVLELLERSDRPLRLVDLSRGTGLHAATALRIVGVLQRRGLVQQEGGEYRLGAGALGLAHGFLVSDPLTNRARGVLQQLADSTHLTASLYVRTGHERILTARVDGRDPLRYQLPVGRRLSLVVGAGKTILAFTTADEREAVLAHHGETRDANGSPVSVEELRSSLDEIHRNGFHVSIAERDVAVAAVSAPVFDQQGAVIGAVSASGPAEHNERAGLEALVPEIRRAAQAVGR